MIPAQFDYRAIDEQHTDQLGRQLGRLLPNAFIVTLDGNLGAGKTRLTQAIAIGLEIPTGQVKSPTFTLSIPHSGRLELLHVDAYRINQLSEVDELGLDDWLELGGVLIIEWANRISAALPPVDLAIKIETETETCRAFQLIGQTAKGAEIVKRLETWATTDKS